MNKVDNMITKAYHDNLKKFKCLMCYRQITASDVAKHFRYTCAKCESMLDRQDKFADPDYRFDIEKDYGNF